jgi:hypothetical protein
MRKSIRVVRGQSSGRAGRAGGNWSCGDFFVFLGLNLRAFRCSLEHAAPVPGTGTSDQPAGAAEDEAGKGADMAETIDDITINWTDDTGKLVVKELQKEVLTRGSWTTILFLYQEMDKRTGEYGPQRIRIGRYQKRGGQFLPQSKFNISSAKQARQLLEIVGKWLPSMDSDANDEE